MTSPPLGERWVASRCERWRVDGFAEPVEVALDVVDQLDILSSDGRAKDVFAERFSSCRVVGSGRGCGMQREAMGGGTEPLGMLELAART